MIQHKRTTPKIFARAQELRHKPSEAESKSWAYLRGNKLNGIKFRRQHAIGRYIADFCAPRQKLIIELDGSHHLGQGEYDGQRTKFLESKGYKVLRFWNNQVGNEIEAVMKAIIYVLASNERGSRG